MNAETPDVGFDRRLARNPIAIVGLSGLFPRSRNVRQFWENIMTAQDCMQDVPADHWLIDDYYDPDHAAEDKTYCRRGGFLPEVQFSPLEFGLPPKTLEVTDILQLLSLVVARDLMRDAGADEAPWYNAARTGVILGVTGANTLVQPLVSRLQTPVLRAVLRSCDLSEQDAEQIAEKFIKAYIPWEENSFPGMLGNLVAGRIANRFDLGSTNCTVDAACASSLAAIKMSVSELLEGRADLMISGGCDAENTIFMYMCFSKTPAFSKSGVIRPFGADADGTLIGEGIGMVALKRLSDAERDEDRIYAVIRGIGTASDGRFKSIYAPRAAGQVVCLKRAYEDADCSPDSIGLLEGHGTGTAVGDATELSALHAVYSEATDELQFAAVGSVKSQIGHTKAAAGAASMIKAALSLHHKVLPPTINVDIPNPAIDFGNTAFYVNTETRPWIRSPLWPRRAAISAFGFGGTDFHVILEEHDGQPRPLEVLHPTARAWLWHAPDPSALARLLDEGAETADDGPIPAEDARLGFASVAGDFTELLELARAQLSEKATQDQWSHPKGVFYRRRSAAETAGKVAALFTGQGSQYVGMGREAVLNVPPLRVAFDEANMQFAGAPPLSRVVFPPPGAGPDEDAREGLLRQTEYAQPGICALACGQYRFLADLGFAPDGTIGHSLGELTALWAAGCFADEDLFRLASARGRAMAPQDSGGQDAGSMAVIIAPESRVRDLLAAYEDLVICNYNAPDQVAVGGGSAAIEALLAQCAREGTDAQRLPVAAAFHTRFVAHAVEIFRLAIAAADFRPPSLPVYANTSGAVYGDDLTENRRILAEQLINPVSFAPQILAMYQDGFRVFVEFGPKRVLARLVAKTLPNHDDVLVYAADGGPGRDSDAHLKRTAVELAVLGLPLTGINRYSAAPEVGPAPSKLAIPISGVNIVSEDRKAAYRDALENGYTVSRPVSSPVTAPLSVEPAAARSVEPEPAPRPAAAIERISPAEVVPSAIEPPRRGPALAGNGGRPTGRHNGGQPAAEGLLQVAQQHLELHSDYLEGQLRTADYLVALAGTDDGTESGSNVRAMVEAIKDHGLVLGRTHTRASEILRDLAGAGPGTPAGLAGPMPAPPAGLAGPTPAPPASLTSPTPAPPAGLTGPTPSLPEAGTSVQAGYAPAGSGPPGAAAAISPPVAPASAVPSETGVMAALLAVVADKTGYPADTLEPDMDMEADLGIDSIKRVEILGALRERFPAAVTIGPEQMAELRTLADVVTLIAPGEAGSGPPGAAAAISPPVAPASAVPSETGVMAALLAVVADKTGYPADTLEPGMDMEADLGIDSIKRVEILGALRERFPAAVTIGPEQMAELRTLADVVTLIAPGEAVQLVPAPDVEIDAAAVQQALLAVVADKTGYPADTLEPGMDMEADLGIDSIKRVEILGALRERYPQAVTIGPEQMAELRTLADVVTLIAPAMAVPAAPQKEQAAQPHVAEAATPDIVRQQVGLSPLPAVDRQPDVYAAEPIAILVDDGSALCPALANALSATGWEIAVLRLPGARPRRYERHRVWDLTSWDEQDLQDAEDALSGVTQVELCLYPAAEPPATWEDASDRLAHAVMLAKHIQLPLTRAAGGGRAAFVTVTRLDGALGLHGTATEPAALLGGLQGLVKTLAIEAPSLFCRALDIAPEVDDETTARLVIDEIYDADTEPIEVGHDGTHRQTTCLTGTSAPPPTPTLPELTPDDLLVVTGGGRSVTAQCVKSLIRQTPCGLVLLGRTALEEEPDWAVLAIGENAVKAAAAHHLRDVGQKPTPLEIDRLTRRLLEQREVRATLADLQGLGADAQYLTVDVTDEKATAAALAPFTERITGIIHGAGVLADHLILDKTPPEVIRVLAAKVAGLHNVLAVADRGRLRHMMVFTSVAGFCGNRGQSDYAMANAALNSVAAAWKNRHPECHVTAINWGAWAGGMVTPQLQQLFEERGVTLIPIDVGTGMFAEQFTRAHLHDVVTVIAPPVPLSVRPHQAPATTPVVTERVLDGLGTEPVIQDHRLAGKPVLPTTVAIGWCINSLERLYPGMSVAEAWEFKVFKGVSFTDNGAAGAYRLQATPQEPYDGSRVDVLIRSGNAAKGTRATKGTSGAKGTRAAKGTKGDSPHYGGSFRLVPGTEIPAATIDPGNLAGHGESEKSPYQDGTLFHGPALQGIIRTLAEDKTRLVAECRLDETSLADTAYDGHCYSPVQSDLLLQAALVWVRRFRDSACLPVSINHIELYQRLPSAAPFLVVVDQVEDHGTTVSCSVTACSRDGDVYERFTGVSVALSQTLDTKFSHQGSRDVRQP